MDLTLVVFFTLWVSRGIIGPLAHEGMDEGATTTSFVSDGDCASLRCLLMVHCVRDGVAEMLHCLR